MDTRGKELIVIFTQVLLMNINENCCHARLQINYQSTTPRNYFQLNEMQQEKLDKKIKILKHQAPVVRILSNTLLKYSSYKDVSILHFRMPHDTRRALFIFKAIEEPENAFQRKCKPRNISLHLKSSSYPVISPENITFPRSFLKSDERSKIYTLQFKSDEEQARILVDAPEIGNWFAVAFVSWTDPNNDRIEQQGLTASCDTSLLAEMSVSHFYPFIINNRQTHNSSLVSDTDQQNSKTSTSKKNNTEDSQKQDLEEQKIHAKSSSWSTFDKLLSKSKIGDETLKIATITKINTYKPLLDLESELTWKSYDETNMSIRTNSSATVNNEIVYKFFVPRHIGLATARITFDHVCSQCPDVGFYVQANAFPGTDLTVEKSHMHSAVIKPNQTGEISIEFYVKPMNWHYVLLKFADQNPLPIKSFEGHIRLETNQKEQVRPRSSKRLKRPMRQTMQSPKYILPFIIQIDFQELSEKTVFGKVKYENIRSGASDKYSRNSTIYNTTSETIKPSKAGGSNKLRGMQFYPLLRHTYRESFMYDYDLEPDENGTVPTVLNLTAGIAAGLSFEVGEVYDIGGTLTFAVSMKESYNAANQDTTKSMQSFPSTRGHSRKNDAGKLVTVPDLSLDYSNNFEESIWSKSKHLQRSNQTIIICMHLGEPGEPTWPDKCRYGLNLLPASSVVNNFESGANTGLIHVPFPESGIWYVTMGLYCHGSEGVPQAIVIDSVKEFITKYAFMFEYMRKPCTCALKLPLYKDCINDPDCLSTMNATETFMIKECLTDPRCTSHHLEMAHKFELHNKFAREQSLSFDSCSTSVIFTISSSPCVAGGCGRYGRCYRYMSGGFVFSTCVCMKGYRGWDCTEDSLVPSRTSNLIASLLLTLSNLLFCPSIYVAGHRKLYTEAIIYFFAMFFSTFYHACDAGEDEYSFCLVKISVLQFCDFYCGLLAIWVTLVAMAHIRQQFASLLHMLGAITLAFGTELNKQSLWVFLAPTLTGICLISVSWGMRCYKSRKWFPARSYLTLYVPLGTVLAMAGLVCYAFLQTKQNYHIVHSIWHMIMALSILCLLPSRKLLISEC